MTRRTGSGCSWRSRSLGCGRRRLWPRTRGRIQLVVATPSGGGGRMGRPQGWAAARAGRPAARWPGRPPAARREHRQRFWVAIARGMPSEDAGIVAGVSPAVGTRWFRDSGGIRPVSLAPPSGRYLSFAEREEIAILRVRGCGVREIARRRLVLGPPKSRAGTRTVAIPASIIPTLRDHLDTYVGSDGTALVFTGPRGDVLRRGNFRRGSGWVKAAAGVGV